MKKCLFILLLCSLGISGLAQIDSVQDITIDTNILPVKPVIKKPRVVVKPFVDTTKTDSLINADSSLNGVIRDSVPKIQAYKGMDTFYAKLLNNPYLPINGEPVYLVIDERKREAKDEMFYLFAGLFLLLALIKLLFSRYFKNIFRLFFQPSFRQKQTREQLLQSNLPSLFLNLFFIFSAGAYIALLVEHFKLINLNFWFLYLYAIIVLLILYTGKYLFLSFAGWVFDAKEASDTYIFVVYLMNKILGVLLMPVVLIIAFSSPQVKAIGITTSVILIILSLVYRYLVSYSPVRREIKVNFLHFFFYVLAFEIIPLLVIYKTFINYMHNSL